MVSTQDRHDVWRHPGHAEGPDGFVSLLDLLDRRALEQAADPAYVFLSAGAEQRLDFARLRALVRRLAGDLAMRAAPGARALLVFPSGLEFVVAFYACLAAGILPVPVMPSRRHAARDATLTIAADCAPALALFPAGTADDTTIELMARLTGQGVDCVEIDLVAVAALPDQAFACRPGPEALAFLQYTSGSTAAPKGVMVSHGNLIANLAMLREAFGNSERSTHVSWLPLYHDMGLILNVLETLFLGALCVLMTPASFMHRPLNWLRAIHDYGAEVAAAPNFAYDLCVDRLRPDAMAGIDLGGWKVASVGAEPVRAASLRRFAAAFAPYGFRETTLFPAYGLAEATLFASSSRRGRGPKIQQASQRALRAGAVAAPERPEDAAELVSIGSPTLAGSIAIVDPLDCRRVTAGRVGEVWIRGPHVAHGYWQRPAESAAVFAAAIADTPGADWLRSGDLGCILSGGDLCIVGRIKDVIIIRGANHHPSDIEATVAASHVALRRDGGAAFGVVDAHGEERLVVVQEVERMFRVRADRDAVVAAIREAVVLEHGIMTYRVVLVRPGSLAKTTSGKIQRGRIRAQFLAGTLELWTEPASGQELAS